MNRIFSTMVVAGCLLMNLSVAAMGQTPALLDDAFDGAKLNDAVWTKGGTNNPVQAVRDGSLRLVTSGMMNQAFVVTKQSDLNLFKQPVIIVWDLVADKTLAGPFGATSWSKAYAGLSIGADKIVAGPGASLSLAYWPEDFPNPKSLDAGWYYTLSFGDLVPKYPNADCRLSGVPQRIIWTVSPTNWSVEIKGAKFVTGDPQTRSGKHELKEADFADSGFHLLILGTAHAKSVEPGANFLGGTVYTDRISVVTSAEAISSYTEVPHKQPLTMKAQLQELVGDGYAETAAPSKLQYMFGINYAGGTFRPNEGFIPPTAQSLDYWKSKGVMLMRLPFNWEPLQPKLNEPLDEKYVAALKQSVSMMQERGMKVLLDMHDYDRYNGQLIGSESVPTKAYSDVWKRLAEVFKDNPAIWGYGIMNEPYRTNGTWPVAAQAGIDGVRSVDTTTMIVIGGDGFSGTQHWSSNGAELPKQLRDPSNNLCWEGHCYFDNNSSGKYNFTYEYELNRSNTNLDPMIGVKRLKPFVKWLKKNHYKGIVGEFSVPANLDRDPRWLVVLDNVYEYLRKNEIPNTFWAGGTLWTPGRSYIVEPECRSGPDLGKDRPQLQILLKHARAFAGPATE